MTEALKAANQLEWVRRMNGIHNRAEEIVPAELAYTKERGKIIRFRCMAIDKSSILLYNESADMLPWAVNTKRIISYQNGFESFDCKGDTTMPRKAEPSCVTEQDIFPTQLRNLIKERKTTQRQLAAAIGMRPQTVSLYAKGQSVPDINCLNKIADYFQVSTDYLLGRTAYMTQDSNIQSVCQSTGLSESSAGFLMSAYDFPGGTSNDWLDMILRSESRDEIARDMMTAFTLFRLAASKDETDDCCPWFEIPKEDVSGDVPVPLSVAAEAYFQHGVHLIHTLYESQNAATKTQALAFRTLQADEQEEDE